MPTLNIGGTKVKVGDDFLKLSPEQQQATVDEIATQIGATAAPPEQAPAEPVQTQAAPTVGYGEDMLRSAASGLRSGAEGIAGMFGDAAQMQGDITGWAAGKLGASPESQLLWRKGGRALSPAGFLPSTEEIQAGTNAAIGEGYKPQTMPGEYARTVAQFAPNLASPGTAARKVASTVIPALVSETAGQLTKGTAAEPYARGAGALAGGVATMGRNVKVPKAAAPTAPTAPTAADVADQSRALYKASEAEGVAFNAQPIDRLKTNLKVMAGDINEKLRPVTAGTVEDIEKTLKGPMTLEKFDELRQGINLDLKTAKGNDKRILTRMKDYLDNFADNIKTEDMTGGPNGVKHLKEARKLWAQSKKAETIERIMDQAGVDGAGKYTQSGFANAVRREMNTLYKSIKKGKAPGWSKEEVALIRQMARGGSNSRMVNLLAKFDPKGPVSILGGQFVGSAIPGFGNVAVPLAGLAAGRAADKGAMVAAERLRSGAATGSVASQFPALPKDPNALIRLLMNAKSGENSAKANTPVR